MYYLSNATYGLRGSYLTNITYDDYNYTDINYTDVHDTPIFVSWLEWFLSWIYL